MARVGARALLLSTQEVIMTTQTERIRTWMTPHPVTIDPEMSVPDAAALMKKGGFRRLIVTRHRDLVGIVTDRDLREAMPSDATSLSVWEINFLIAQLKVKEIMTTDVVTISDDASLEQAAQIMLERRIGGLPVMNGPEIAGIVTTTDVLRAFIERDKRN
jgi:acetoin utilization protein AcuB